MYKITVEKTIDKEENEKYPSYKTIYEQVVAELEVTEVINAVNKRNHV